MRSRRAWQTVILKSGLSVRAEPRIRAMEWNEDFKSIGSVQNPGKRAQIWERDRKGQYYEQEEMDNSNTCTRAHDVTRHV